MTMSYYHGNMQVRALQIYTPLLTNIHYDAIKVEGNESLSLFFKKVPIAHEEEEEGNLIVAYSGLFNPTTGCGLWELKKAKIN